MTVREITKQAVPLLFYLSLIKVGFFFFFFFSINDYNKNKYIFILTEYEASDFYWWIFIMTKLDTLIATVATYSSNNPACDFGPLAQN